MDLIPITFNKVLQSRSYTVIILGTNEKKFAIYADPSVGRNIQAHLTAENRARPLSHDLLNTILKGLNAKILQIVIQDVEDTIYFARIYIEQIINETRTILEIDARPSDCITLALMNSTPVFCNKEVLERTIPVQDQ